MSFSTLNYESNILGLVLQIRVDDAIETAVGAAPTAAQDAAMSVYVRKPASRYGIEARAVTVRFTETATTPGENEGDEGTTVTCTSDRIVPVLTQATFESAQYQLNAELTVDGETGTIVARRDENVD